MKEARQSGRRLGLGVSERLPEDRGCRFKAGDNRQWQEDRRDGQGTVGEEIRLMLVPQAGQGLDLGLALQKVAKMPLD
jgi:hypothetical protein